MVCADDGATRALTSAVGHHHRPVRTRRDRSRAACAPPREACAKPRAHGSTLGCWQAGWHDLGSASTSRTRCSSIWPVGAPPPRSSARAAAAPREPSLSASHSNALNRRHRSAHWLCGGYAAGYAEAIRCAPHSLCRQAMPHSLRCLLCVTARCLTRRARRCSSSRTGGPATRGPATGELRIGYAAGYAVRAA